MSEFKGKRVLIVEDNFMSYKLLEAYLNKTGLEMVHATDGEQAVNYFHTDEFDLVLMDIQIPRISGLDATKLMREKRPDLPIIATTANAFDSDREACLKAGCTEFITKPIHFPHLIETMKQLLS